MAYEVIKRVSGRAYRYRVESYRDPETRRVRGKWTYLGRVEGEGTLSPERKARPVRATGCWTRSNGCSRPTSLRRSRPAWSPAKPGSPTGRSTGTSATSRTSCATRWCARRPTSKRHNERFSELLGEADAERAKLVAWIREAIAAVLSRPGLFRAWHVTSNHDWAVVAERQRRFEANVEHMARYLEPASRGGHRQAHARVRGVRDHRARRRGDARSGDRQSLLRSQTRRHHLGRHRSRRFITVAPSAGGGCRTPPALRRTA